MLLIEKKEEQDSKDAWEVTHLQPLRKGEAQSGRQKRTSFDVIRINCGKSREAEKIPTQG